MKAICETCVYYRETHRGGPKISVMGNCMYDPPKVQFIPHETQMDAKTIQRGGVPQVQMVAASAKPQVFAGDFCARHAYNMDTTE